MTEENQEKEKSTYLPLEKPKVMMRVLKNKRSSYKILQKFSKTTKKSQDSVEADDEIEDIELNAVFIRKINRDIYFSLYDRYRKLRKENQEMSWIIKKEDILYIKETDEVGWDNYKKAVCLVGTYGNIVDDNSIIFKEKYCKTLEEIFRKVYSYEDESFVVSSGEESLEDDNSKENKTYRGIEVNDYDNVTLDEEFSVPDFISFLNDKPELAKRFKFNDKVPTANAMKQFMGTNQKAVFHCKRKKVLEQNLSWVTSYMGITPEVNGEKITKIFDIYDFMSDLIIPVSVPKADGSGMKIEKVKIAKTSVIKDNEIPLHVAMGNLIDPDTGKIIMQNATMYSIKEIDRGIHLVNFIFAENVTKHTDKDRKKIILSQEPYMPTDYEFKFEDIKGKHKIFSIMKTYREYFEKTGKPLDERGLLAQICLNIQALNRMIFRNKNVCVAIIGDKNLSKTRPATFIGALYDSASLLVKGKTNLTVRGIIGGVNKVNNSNVFEEGIVTYGGIVIFDEAQSFFEVEEFMELLKNFFDMKIINVKVGANGVEVDVLFTPILITNRLDFHNDKDDDIRKKNVNNFLQMLKRNYYTILQNLSEADKEVFERENHIIKRVEADKYVLSKNFTLPEEYIFEQVNNIHFIRAVISTKKEFKYKSIDWRTGCPDASSDRINFNLICYRNENEVERKLNFDTGVEEGLSDLQPSNVFMKELGEYLGHKEYEHYYVLPDDLDPKHKDAYARGKLLVADIKKKLEEDPILRDYIVHVIGGDRKNPLLLLNFYTLAKLQNPLADRMDDISWELGKKLVYMTNRGVLKEEYDFIKTDYVPSKMVIDMYKGMTEENMKKFITERNVLEKEEKSLQHKALTDEINKAVEEKLKENEENPEEMDSVRLDI